MNNSHISAGCALAPGSAAIQEGHCKFNKGTLCPAKVQVVRAHTWQSREERETEAAALHCQSWECSRSGQGAQPALLHAKGHCSYKELIYCL